MKDLYLVVLDGQACWAPDSIWETKDDAERRAEEAEKDPINEDLTVCIKKIKIGEVFPFPEEVEWLYK